MIRSIVFLTLIYVVTLLPLKHLVAVLTLRTHESRLVRRKRKPTRFPIRSRVPRSRFPIPRTGFDFVHAQDTVGRYHGTCAAQFRLGATLDLKKKMFPARVTMSDHHRGCVHL